MNIHSYNHVEVYGHNLELSDLRFLYGFLHHREGGMVSIRFSYFLLYRNCKRLREFQEIEISSKAVEVTVKR